MKKTKAYNIAFTGVLCALAFAFSYFERLFPLTMIIPIPGVKLGLANVITMYALCGLSFRHAAAVLFIRCFLNWMLFGSAVSFALSIAGGVLSLAVMAALLRIRTGRISLIGISMAGAAAHNTGQILAACIIMRQGGLMIYLAPLLLTSIPFGVITGIIAIMVLSRLKQIETAR